MIDSFSSDEVGEEIAELHALVLDGLEGVERGADAGGERWRRRRCFR